MLSAGALAAGVMGNDSRIDEELLFARAIDGLTEMHVRALAQLADGRQLTARTLVQTDPGLERGAIAILHVAGHKGLLTNIAGHARWRDDPGTDLLYYRPGSGNSFTACPRS